MAAALGSAPETARGAQSQPLHATPGASSTVRERKALRADARRIPDTAQRRGEKISSRWLGASLATRRFHVHLHDCARRSPPRPDLHARAPTRLSAADQACVRNLELGKTLETVRFHQSTLDSASGELTRVAKDFFAIRVLRSKQDQPADRSVKGALTNPRELRAGTIAREMPA